MFHNLLIIISHYRPLFSVLLRSFSNVPNVPSAGSCSAANGATTIERTVS